MTALAATASLTTLVASPAASDTSPLTLDLGNGASVTLYGYIKAEYIYDNGFELGATTGPLSSIGLPTGPAVGSFETTQLIESRFGFKVTATPDISALFEWDFYGPRNNPRLRLAYVDFGNLRVGQDWTTFMSLETLADTVDFTGARAQPFARPPMVAYRFRLDDQTQLIAAVEEDIANSSDVTYNLALRRAFDAGMVRVSAIYRDTDIGRFPVDGWGVNFAGVLEPWQGGKIKLNVATGDGVADYLGAGFAPIAASFPGATTNFLGASLGISHKLTDRLTLAATGDYSEIDQAVGTETESMTTLHLSAFYNLTDSTRLMGEYYTGERVQADGTRFDVDRIQLAIFWSF